MLFSAEQRNILFKIFASLSCLAGLYHLANLFYKMDESPLWRHLLFIVITMFCMYGFIKRPPYFVYFMAALFLQQCYSHGTFLFDLWTKTRQVHWISVFDLLLIPIGLICLIEDNQIKKRKLM